MQWEQTVTVIASLATALGVIGLYRRQAQALDEQRRSLVGAQAHRVTAWADPNPSEHPPTQDGLRWYRVTIENSGDEAVYGVRLVNLGIGKKGEPSYGSPMTVLPAKSRHETAILKASDSVVPRFKLSFMDSRGKHWVRGEGGVAYPVPFPAEGSALIINTDQPRRWRRVRPVQQKEEREPERY